FLLNPSRPFRGDINLVMVPTPRLGPYLQSAGSFVACEHNHFLVVGGHRVDHMSIPDRHARNIGDCEHLDLTRLQAKQAIQPGSGADARRHQDQAQHGESRRVHHHDRPYSNEATSRPPSDEWDQAASAAPSDIGICAAARIHALTSACALGRSNTPPAWVAVVAGISLGTLRRALLPYRTGTFLDAAGGGLLTPNKLARSPRTAFFVDSPSCGGRSTAVMTPLCLAATNLTASSGAASSVTVA